MLEKFTITHPSKKINGTVEVPGSKSESNRLLLLQALYFPEMEVPNLSDSRDTSYMLAGLNNSGSKINVGDAGTAMRFLTAYFATRSGRTVEISGTERMHLRPIGILVEALKTLGASIEYLEKENYPPLKIKGSKLEGGELKIDGSVSSQFISALMMIGPGMKNGLKLELTGEAVSLPYLHLTTGLMRSLGFEVAIVESEINIAPGLPGKAVSLAVEPDWSAASYWYLMAFLADEADLFLPGFRADSLQGDAELVQLFKPLGLSTSFDENGIRLLKAPIQQKRFEIDLVQNPDLAQTLAVAFAAKQIPAKITGLQTLKIKETDRLVAVKTELEKTGAEVEIGEDYLEIKKGIKKVDGVSFETYEDHRMAMAFAPLALLGEISINHPAVVAKSYQSFWDDLEKVGFTIEQ